MRRNPLTLAAAAVLVPLTMLVIPGSATAAASSLKVTTLNRAGVAISSSVSVVAVPGGDAYRTTSGKALSLPAGTYAVLTDVWNTHETTDTLGAKIVSVSGATTTTIDARQGKLVNASLDSSPGPDYDQHYDARICANGVSYGAIEAGAFGDNLFVIPNSSKVLSFAYESSWETYAAPGDAYVVSALTSGIPSGVATVYRKSNLATLSAQVRNGPSGGPLADLGLQPSGQTSTTDCQAQLFAEAHSDNTPFALKVHVSAGKWYVRSDSFAQVGDETWDIGSWGATKTFAPAGSYSQIFYLAAWGPAHNLPYVYHNTIAFDGGDMFVDPASSVGFEASDQTTSTLSFGGKVLSRQTNTDYGDGASGFRAAVKTAGWYTLSVSGTRYHPGVHYPIGSIGSASGQVHQIGMLSTAATVSFHFYAKPSGPSVTAPVYLTRFVPLGLDLYNHAKPSTKTPVTLVLDREAQGPDQPLSADTPKTVVAWASTDGGKTWHTAPVTHSGTSWTALVSNPAKGDVALRAEVTDAQGNSATVTVYRAYAIG